MLPSFKIIISVFYKREYCLDYQIIQSLGGHKPKHAFFFVLGRCAYGFILTQTMQPVSAHLINTPEGTTMRTECGAGA